MLPDIARAENNMNSLSSDVQDGKLGSHCCRDINAHNTLPHSDENRGEKRKED